MLVMHHNGLLLNFVRVSAAFHCPPLNNMTKIKLSQQTTKPRIEFEQLLGTVCYLFLTNSLIFQIKILLSGVATAKYFPFGLILQSATSGF